MLTGPDGFFVFRDLPLDSFTLTAAKPGYSEGAFGRRRPGGQSQQLPLTDSESPARDRRADVEARRNHRRGHRRDRRAADRHRDSVLQAGGGQRRAAIRFAARAATDDRGVYRLPNLPPGEYMVAASSRQVAVPLSLADESRDRRTAPVTDTTLGGPVPMPGNASGLQLGDSVFGLAPDGATPPPPEGDRLSIYPPTFHPATPSALESSTVALRSGEERDGIDLQLRPVRTVRVSGFLTRACRHACPSTPPAGAGRQRGAGCRRAGDSHRRQGRRSSFPQFRLGSTRSRRRPGPPREPAHRHAPFTGPRCRSRLVAKISRA